MEPARHFIKSPITRKNPVSPPCNFFFFLLTKYWGVFYANF